MTTGLHTVRDVMCAKCGEVLGWKYGSFNLDYLSLAYDKGSW